MGGPGWELRGQEFILVKNAPSPALLGPCVGFCSASANFPFHAPRRGGGSAREARHREGGGRLAFNAFLALTKWPFSTKMIFSKRSKIHDIKY